MKKFVSIDELPRYAPGQTWLARNLLNGRGVALRGYLYAPSNVSAPGLQDDLVVAYLNGAAAMTRSVAGHTASATVAPGRISLLSRRSHCEWSWDEPLRVLHIYLPEPVVRRVHEQMFAGRAGRIELRNDLDVEDAVLHRIAQELACGDYLNGPGADLYAEALTQQICVHILRRHMDATGERVSDGRRLARRHQARIAAQLDESLGGELSIASLAGELGVSEGHFLRLFKATFGMAPHRYVIARRLDRSCELLRLRDVSIAEIASRTGFSDQSHFTRHFKRHYRTTPFAWRRAARGQSAP